METTRKEKPIFAITGITGNQGRSIAEAFIKKGSDWQLKGLVRDLSSSNATKLRGLGVELIEGSLTKNEDLLQLFNGAEACYINTTYWDPSQGEKEVEVGKLMCDAAKESGVKFTLIMNLVNVHEVTKGKLDVPFFTNKSLIADYAKSIGLRIVELSPSFYYSNIENLFAPKFENGEFVFSLPLSEDKSLTMFNVNDYGHIILNILSEFHKWEGRNIPIVGEILKLSQLPKIFTEVTGKPAIYKEIDLNIYAKNAHPSIVNLFRYLNEYPHFGRDVDLWLGMKIYPNMTDFKEWLTQEGLTPFNKIEQECLLKKGEKARECEGETKNIEGIEHEHKKEEVGEKPLLQEPLSKPTPTGEVQQPTQQG